MNEMTEQRAIDIITKWRNSVIKTNKFENDLIEEAKAKGFLEGLASGRAEAKEEISKLNEKVSFWMVKAENFDWDRQAEREKARPLVTALKMVEEEGCDMACPFIAQAALTAYKGAASDEA